MGQINHVHFILILAALISVYVMAEFYYDTKYGPGMDLKGVELHAAPAEPTTTVTTTTTKAPEATGKAEAAAGVKEDNEDEDEDDENAWDDDEDEDDESYANAKLSFSSSSSSSQSQSQSHSASDRPLIMYAYSESDNARSNLEFFLHQGLHGGADFVFVLNGPAEEALQLIRNQTADLQLGNVEVVERPNTCYDLGAHGEVLRAGDRWRRYARFVLLNASIRGPFVPYWSRACWSDAYLAKITDKVKLVGMTANCNPQFHIQSMIWATDAIGMELLLYPQQQRQQRQQKRQRQRQRWWRRSSSDESGDERTGEDNEEMEAETETETETEATNTTTTTTTSHAYPTVEPGGGVALQGCYNGWNRAIGAEVGTTAMIREAGYDVDAMMAAYHKKPPSKPSSKPSKPLSKPSISISKTTDTDTDTAAEDDEDGDDDNDNDNENEDDYAVGCGVAEAEGGSAGDVLWDGRYFGSNVHPYETVFTKANRDIDPRTLELLTEWHLNGTMGRDGSRDVCS